MCEYVKRKELIDPRIVVEEWIKRVQSIIKEEAGITFTFEPIGSAKRGMVVRKCNENYFDFDYKLVLQKIPNVLVKDCKTIKSLFKRAFDSNKPFGFCDCRDRSQSLRTRNNDARFGLDIVIFKVSNGNEYILFNNKDSNNANNNDYQWQIRPENKKYRERFEKINGSEMWEYLRKIYLNDRCKYKDDQNDSKKAAYQIFNDAVVKTLEHFKIPY